MSNRRRKFYENHPFCCFCGGGAQTTSIDHLPSRACFDEKQYPVGFEFPACDECNASTKGDEQIVAALSRAQSNPEAEALPGEIEKYFRGVNNNRPEILVEMAERTRRFEDGGGMFELGDEGSGACRRVFKRWAKAFHYKETGQIVPGNGRVETFLFTNANIDQIPEAALYGKVHELRRAGKNIGDQFMYVTINDPERLDVGFYTVAFRRSFLVIMLVDFTGEVLGKDERGLA